MAMPKIDLPDELAPDDDEATDMWYEEKSSKRVEAAILKRFAASAPAGEPSETEKANLYFFNRVQQIHGVEVVFQPDKGLAEQTFIVFVQSRRGDASRQIRDLQAEIYNRFPSARLDVWVREGRAGAEAKAA